jgi:hypothetical protein
MDAEADVLEELKSGWNGDKLANALSLLTALVLEELKSGRNSDKIANALSLLTALK